MKTFLSFIFFLICCAACEDSEKKPEPYLTIEVENNVCYVGAGAETVHIKVRTNLQDWEVVPRDPSGYEWCEKSVGISGSGIHLLTLSVSANDNMGKREAEFVFRGDGIEEQSLKVVQLGTEPKLLVDAESKLLSKDAQTFTLRVTSNVKYTISNAGGWMSREEAVGTKSVVETVYRYEVVANADLFSRRDTICIASTAELKDTLLSVRIPVEQKGADVDDVFPDDVKLKIESVRMVRGTQYGTQSPDLTLDGDVNTFYGSGKHQDKPAVIFEYTLAKDIEKIDYVVFYQRSGRQNLSKGIIECRSESVEEWTECGKFEVTDNAPSFKVGLKNAVRPTHLRVTLERKEGEVALAEFECWQSAGSVDYDLEADALYFEDDIFSRLKPTVTEADIPKITHPVLRAVAQELLEGTYSEEFRVRTYKSCRNPRYAVKELTIGKRSVCDNSMGLFFERDKKYIIFVGDELGSRELYLGIYDWREERDSRVVPLKRGLNIVKAEISGNGCVQYWTETEIPAPDVRIHVCLGNEIGFWDVRAGHDNEDWKRILETAGACARRLNIPNAMIDVAGERVQLVNTVEAFKVWCPDDIETVMKTHDELMQIEYTMMGLVKNNAVPRNRILGVRSWGGSPNWNGTCANFPNNEEAMLTGSAFLKNIWVFGHEFGHGNQIAQMREAGWAEVTNNLYGQQAMFLMDQGRCRIEHTYYKRQGYKEKVWGDLFNAYLNDAVVRGKPYLTHEAEWKDDPKKGRYQEANPFVSLAPLWQLSLFYMLTEDAPWSRPDFWPDVHWDAIHDRNPVAVNKDYGQRYVRFMKRVMDFSGYDMSGFFGQMGLLKEFSVMVGDYGEPKQVTLTQAMVEEVKAYGRSQSPAPTPVIHYISANSLQTYRKRLPVQGIFNEGITSGDLSVTISHSVWQNAVAFETYADEKMVEVCIVGTGSEDNSSTFVRYPEGATRIEAVAWDGKRTLVYGKR